MGPFDSEKGIYLDTEGYENGHWYLNAEGQLYIVPDAEAEIEGPDDEIEAALNTIYRDKPFADINQSEVATTLGLEVVLDVFKRFSPEAGYYNA